MEDAKGKLEFSVVRERVGVATAFFLPDDFLQTKMADVFRIRFSPVFFIILYFFISFPRSKLNYFCIGLIIILAARQITSQSRVLDVVHLNTKVRTVKEGCLV